MCVLVGSLRPPVSAAVCVPQAQEWRPIVNKKTPNASHVKRVSVPDPALKSCVHLKYKILNIKSFRNSFTFKVRFASIYLNACTYFISYNLLLLALTTINFM